MKWNRTRRIGFLYLAAILVISQGCSPTASLPEPSAEETASLDSIDEVGEVDEAGEDDQSGEVGREAMVFVVDPDYNPIPNAVIGINGNYTDMSGVFYGEVKANDSGWVPVQALGYVTNYAKPSPFSGEYDLYFVTLAPVDTGFYYQETSGSHLQLGDQEEPNIEVDLEPGALEGEGFLELTQIDPGEICMDDAWAELDNPYDAILSFDISAWNLDGEAINLAENKTAMVLIPDNEHDVNDLVLQSFDPESGSWIDLEGACTRLDSETIQCALSHFSMHNFMEKNLEPWQRNTKEIVDFRNHYYDLGRLYKSGEDQGTGDEGTNNEIFDLLKELVEAARKFAKKNPNETGKAMLIYAAQLAQSSGVEGGETLANELIKEAQDLTAEMAKKLAEKADCGHTDEIMNLIQQGQLLGGSAADAANDLVKKVSDQLKNCVIWKGDIHYMFFLLDDFPELEGHWQLQGSGLTWHEYHQVTIGINPLTGKLSGTSKVRVVMNEASYLAEIGGDSCGVDKHYMDVQANPGTGFTTLEFEGTYADQTWSIGPPQEKDAEPAVLFLHQHGLFGCPKQVMELGNTQMFTYKSQLLHGFFGTPQPPSLEEMLNNGIFRKTGDGFEFIRGSEDIYYSSGVNRAPIIPVDHAHLTWSFKRVSTTTMEQ
jgi:plasmid maintenance system antidote protein VapI